MSGRRLSAEQTGGPSCLQNSSLAGGEAGGSAMGLILHQLRQPSSLGEGLCAPSLGGQSPAWSHGSQKGRFKVSTWNFEQPSLHPLPSHLPCLSHTHLTRGACESRLWERGHRFCRTAGSPALGCGEHTSRLNKNISNMKHKVFFCPVNVRVRILVNL